MKNELTTDFLSLPPEMKVENKLKKKQKQINKRYILKESKWKYSNIRKKRNELEK